MTKKVDDKTRIDQSLVEAKKLMAGNKLDDCERTLKSILPTVNRVGFRQLEIHQFLTALKMKQGKNEEAIEMARKVLTLKPDDPSAFKALLTAGSNINSDDLVSDSILALEKCSQAANLLPIIAKYIRDKEKDDLDNAFIKFIQGLPNEEACKYIKALPDREDILEYRISLLKLSPPDDVDQLEDLVYALKDLGDFDECCKFAEKLPENNVHRLYIETLFGDDCVETARKHIAAGKEQFVNFINFYEQSDANKILNEVQVIPDFLSGFILVLGLITDKVQKSAIAETIASKFPKSLRALTAAANAKEETGDFKAMLNIAQKISKISKNEGIKITIRGYIKMGQFAEAEKLIETAGNYSQYDKTQVQIELWKVDKDPKRLKTVLQLPDEQQFAEFKAFAALNLGNAIDLETANKIFATSLKLDRENAAIYAYFGKFMIEYMKDAAKGEFLLRKAFELGYKGPEALELAVADYIKNQNFDEALKHCQMTREPWARLRSGMIYYNQGKYEEAANQLQLYLKQKSDDHNALTVLGYTYLAMGRLVSVLQVSEELESIGHPSKELKIKLDQIYGKNILKDGISEETVANPLLFAPSLQHTIDLIKRMVKFNRVEAAIEVVHKTDGFVSKYVEEFGDKLSSVLKLCGDYYMEAFNITKDAKYAQSSLQLYMKRAEKDKRGECFIDVAEILFSLGKLDQTITVLRRAVKAFPDNWSVWNSLGIAFSISQRYSFAKHCFCVAAKLCEEADKAKVMNCFASLSYLCEDQMTMSTSADEANRLDPNNAFSWEHKAMSGSIDEYSGEILSFKNGNVKTPINILPELCIYANKPLESLGFAFMSGNKNKIAMALEACGKYREAMKFTEDEETLARLRSLCGEKGTGVKYSRKENEELSDLVKAIRSNSDDEKSEILQSLFDSSERQVYDQLRMKLGKETMMPYDRLANIRQGVQYCDKKTIAIEVYNKFVEDLDPVVIRNYVIEILKNDDHYENIMTPVLQLCKINGCRDHILLLALALIHVGNEQDAASVLQQYVILRPQMCRKLMPLIKRLKGN